MLVPSTGLLVFYWTLLLSLFVCLFVCLFVSFFLSSAVLTLSQTRDVIRALKGLRSSTVHQPPCQTLCDGDDDCKASPLWFIITGQHLLPTLANISALANICLLPTLANISALANICLQMSTVYGIFRPLPEGDLYTFLFLVFSFRH